MDSADRQDVSAQAKTLGEIALSPVPLLQPVEQDSAQPAAASASSTAAVAASFAAEGVDFQDIALDEIQLSPAADAKAAEVKAAAPVPGPVATQGKDEWEEVNLARAREMALAADASAAPMPGDKVPHGLACCNIPLLVRAAGRLQLTASALCFMQLV